MLDRQVLYTSQHAGLSNPHFSGAEKRRIQTRTASKIKIPFPAAREKKEACWWCVGLFLVQLNFNKRILSLTLQILLSIIAFIKLWLLKYYWCINFIWHIKCFLQHVSVNIVNPKEDTCFFLLLFLTSFLCNENITVVGMPRTLVMRRAYNHLTNSPNNIFHSKYINLKFLKTYIF